ncbi:MAG: hypothetical protein HYY45_13700 [Deltaproteobacteria bacterium]|nr:hypothetical protein [Deltaproteobacteria bacterium]
MADQEEGAKLTQAEFVKKAIVSLRKNPYKGIHSVYSGFNEAFRAYFNDDPIKWTNQLNGEGVIEIRPARGGIMLYLPGEAPVRSTGKDVLKKMGL